MRGGSFAASFGRQPYGAAAAAHGIPGDRPPAVPAVSRCRARQHHGQGDAPAPGAPGAVKMSQPAGRNAAHCPGWPLQPQRCSASRCAGQCREVKASGALSRGSLAHVASPRVPTCPVLPDANGSTSCRHARFARVDKRVGALTTRPCYAGRAYGAPLTLETSASPAGLTARARPEARPDRRAANLCKIGDVIPGISQICYLWPITL